MPNESGSNTPAGTTSLAQLQTLFSRDVCRQGTKPLSDKIQIAIHVGEEGPFTLTKRDGVPTVLESAPQNPDMVFHIPPTALKQLGTTPANDVGEVGIAILQLMAQSDPQLKITAKVHIGLFELLRKGYLGVLPLGGPSVMKFLGTKGFTGMSKIKDALSKMRD